MKNSRLVAVCALAAALILVLSFVPPAWGIPFLGFVPVIVVITFRKIKTTLFVSFWVGIVSWIFAFIRPSIVGIAFQTNPLLPIVPRLIAGLLAHYACLFVYKLSKSNTASAVTCGIVGSAFNTVLVMGSIVLFVPEVYSDYVSAWAYVAIIIPTAIIEVVINSTVAPVLSVVVKKQLQIDDQSKIDRVIDN